MRTVLLAAVLAALAVPFGLSGQSLWVPSFDIPFAFVAGDTDYPAGTCRLQQPSATNLTISIYCDKNNAKTILVGASTRPLRHSELEKGGDRSYLVFQRIGDHYFLREFQHAGTESITVVSLAKRRQEVVTSLLSANQRSETVILASRR